MNLKGTKKADAIWELAKALQNVPGRKLGFSVEGKVERRFDKTIEKARILGFSISTLALIELGQSFGVSPANRGRITNGVYKITNHPMYFGYVISEFGFLIINPSNFLIFLISSSLYFYRATIENKRLNI